MNEQQMTFSSNLIGQVTPYSALLNLDSDHFYCSEALLNLLKLKDGHDFETFRDRLNHYFGEGKDLAKVIQVAAKSKVEQTINIELEYLETTLYFSVKIKSVTVEESNEVAILLEDQTKMHCERQAFERLTWLSEQLYRQVSSNYLTSEEICDAACKLSILLIGKSDMGSFVKLSEGYLTWPTLVGYDALDKKIERLKFEDSLQWVLSKDAPDEILRIDDLNDLPEILPLMFDRSSEVHTRSMLSAPLHDEGKVFGYINVDSTEVKCFNDYDLMLLRQFIFVVELALERSKLVLKLLDSETRDSQTGLKSLPVAELRIHELLNNDEEKFDIGLVLVDLMGLSTINDRYGWNVGNEAIIATSRQLALMDATNCEVYRLSADQFLLVVTCKNDFKVFCGKLELNLKKFYAEGASISGGRMHIPVIFVYEYVKKDFGSLREILGVLRQKMKIKKDTWRLRMPIF